MLILIFLTLAFAEQTMVFRNGDQLVVQIIEKGPKYIKFRRQGNDFTEVAHRNSVKFIIHDNGVLEEISKLPEIRGLIDWEKVVLTPNPEDVEGLERIGELKGKSGWGGMAKGLGNRGARNSIKKSAAKLKCPIVLIQETLNGGMGTKIIGIGYR